MFGENINKKINNFQKYDQFIEKNKYYHYKFKERDRTISVNKLLLYEDDIVYEIVLTYPKNLKLSDVTINPNHFEDDSVIVHLNGKISFLKVNQFKKNINKINFELENLKKYKTIKKETYEEYLEKKNKINDNDMLWIYNIIEGKSEQHNILYEDNKYILIPTVTCDNTISTLHILGIIRDKSLKTIRDLSNKNIELLEHVHNSGLNEISKIYGVEPGKIRVYIHYPPSCWQLHIHYQVINIIGPSCIVERCHSLGIVIENLKICSDYYKNIIMEVYE